jgi:hypothetical protein
MNPNTRILRRYCHVLAARIAGEPPAFRGKPASVRKIPRNEEETKNDYLR